MNKDLFELLDIAEKRLARKTSRELNTIIRRMDKWFRYTEDGLGHEVSEALSFERKASKVAFIMSGDPLFDEGGLVDFLQREKII